MISGTCDAKCEGKCELSAAATCEGTCEGSCDAKFSGKSLTYFDEERKEHIVPFVIEPYLRYVFGFWGITDVEFITAEGLAVSPEQREASIKSARERIEGPCEALAA